MKYEVWYPVDDTVSVEPMDIEESSGIPVGRFTFKSTEALEWFLVETCKLALDRERICPECGTHLVVSNRHYPAPPQLRHCPNEACAGDLYEMRSDGLTPISREGYREWYEGQRSAAMRKRWLERILH